jgi:L1 cell adhesion molecule like protein
MRIVNEPTAAALAYGFENKEEKTQRNILIYDLGGGTFDVTVLEIKDGIFTVKGTNGDCHLGGEDFDDEILNYCLERFKEEAEIDIKALKKSKVKSRALRRIRNECTKAKIVLSAALQTELNVDAVSEGTDLNVMLSRAKFEMICETHFKKTIPIVDNVLKEAKLKKTEIDDIVLVGGSTRIPKIQNMLKDHFPGQPLDHKINPDEAVA